ncbi:uncharacterized protein LOC110861705 isoform X2 [Folsomia candida]|uniref:uncharacterized protein LOC110861705 isoform X2 n=1 Tax=Folsomia candida TaxID=158441 RepID=UPI000B8FE617|nr:uncharacterized protein LOC110861705 isoform X2 [Folsomia candida]
MSVTKREMEKLIHRVARLEAFVAKIAKHFAQLGSFDSRDDDEGSSDVDYLTPKFAGERQQKIKSSRRKRKSLDKTSTPTFSRNVDDQHESRDPIYIADQEYLEIGPDSVKMEQDSEEEVEIYPYPSDFVIIPSHENNGLQAEVGEGLNLMRTNHSLITSPLPPQPHLPKTGKGAKARDPVWAYFQNVNETTRTWKCKLCGKEFKHAKPDRLRGHIQNKCVKKGRGKQYGNSSDGEEAPIQHS